MRKKIIFCIFLLLPYCIYSNSEFTSEGFFGIEFSLPSIKNNFIPAVKTRLSAPFNLYPEKNTEFLNDINFSTQLSWRSKYIFTAGNINISGTYSLLNSPDLTLPSSPFFNSSFAEGGIRGGLNSYSSSTKTYGATASLVVNKNTKKPVLLQLGLKENNPIAASLTFPFTFNNINYSLISLIGFYELESTIPNETDSWFLHSVPYEKEIGTGFIQEIRLSSNKNKLQVVLGGFTSPYSNIDLWGRIVGNFTVGVFSWKGGFYCGEKNIISGNSSHIKNIIQFYINPMVNIPIKSIQYGKIKIGCMFGTEKKKKLDVAPLFYVEGDIKGGIEFYVPTFTLRITGGWQNFYLNKKNNLLLKNTEDIIKGNIEFSIRKIPYISTINSSFNVIHYPQKAKTETSFNINIKPNTLQMNRWKQLIPTVSIGTDFVFDKGVFKSCITETKANWQIKKGFFLIRGSLGLKIKKD